MQTMAEAISDIVGGFRYPYSIVETGTYHADGTTKMIADAIMYHGIKSRFVTIECNPTHYQISCANITKMNLPVECRLGLSVPRSVLPSVEKINAEEELMRKKWGNTISYDDVRNSNFYFNETNFQGNDDLLIKTMKELTPVGMVLLDSAGNLGQLEFGLLNDFIQAEPNSISKDFVLVLDDTRHRKHIETMQIILRDSRWKVLVDSHGVGSTLHGKPNGFGVVKYNGN